MLGDLLTLIGMALFIKVFFDGAKKVARLTNGDQVTSRHLAIHSILGIAFIVAGRLIITLL